MGENHLKHIYDELTVKLVRHNLAAALEITAVRPVRKIPTRVLGESTPLSNCSTEHNS